MSEASRVSSRLARAAARRPAAAAVRGSTLALGGVEDLHPQTAKANAAMAGQLTNTGDYAQAEPYYRVIASLLAARWGHPQFDLVAALVITAIIGRIAFGILRRSAGVLADVRSGSRGRS